jgi:hypothetical protein
VRSNVRNRSIHVNYNAFFTTKTDLKDKANRRGETFTYPAPMEKLLLRLAESTLNAGALISELMEEKCSNTVLQGKCTIKRRDTNVVRC